MLMFLLVLIPIFIPILIIVSFYSTCLSAFFRSPYSAGCSLYVSILCCASLHQVEPLCACVSREGGNCKWTGTKRNVNLCTIFTNIDYSTGYHSLNGSFSIWKTSLPIWTSCCFYLFAHGTFQIRTQQMRWDSAGNDSFLSRLNLSLQLCHTATN